MNNILDQACAAFNGARTSSGNAKYIFYLPRRSMAYVGLGCRRAVRYLPNRFEVFANDVWSCLPSGNDPFNELRKLLDPTYPCFLMVSQDLYSAVEETDLPLILCIQPKLEIRLEGSGLGGGVCRPLCAEKAEGWITQSDATFLDRLRQGVEILKDYPKGKMILTRSYQCSTGGRDPLDLFALYSASEPSAACSHYLQIDEDIASLGCSPENVFELEDNHLSFDVVAGTRGISADPEVDMRWLAELQNDPKERREHSMAFERYQQRIETLIKPGSLRIEHQHQVLQLGNVRHLYSRLSGELKPGLDWLKLLSGSIPALTSYPDELKTFSENSIEPLRYYGGVYGRVSADGRESAFYLNLRSALTRKDVLYTQGGVGLIAESEPEKELLEVKNKLKGLMKAVSAWQFSEPV